MLQTRLLEKKALMNGTHPVDGSSFLNFGRDAWSETYGFEFEQPHIRGGVGKV